MNDNSSTEKRILSFPNLETLTERISRLEIMVTSLQNIVAAQSNLVADFLNREKQPAPERKVALSAAPENPGEKEVFDQDNIEDNIFLCNELNRVLNSLPLETRLGAIPVPFFGEKKGIVRVYVKPDNSFFFFNRGLLYAKGKEGSTKSSLAHRLLTRLYEMAEYLPSDTLRIALTKSAVRGIRKPKH